jgi:hypothetical protein
LQRIEFTRLANATVDVPVTPPATFSAPGTVVLSSHPPSIALTVHRVTAGLVTTVETIVTDGCGTWRTFAGGGATAF